jgi:hypothetical protein
MAPVTTGGGWPALDQLAAPVAGSRTSSSRVAYSSSTNSSWTRRLKAVRTRPGGRPSSSRVRSS